jgi:endogenous inhibitor of DNA gyrase (YacG/DUF329 family)
MWFTLFPRMAHDFVILKHVSLFRPDPVLQCYVCGKTWENPKKLRIHLRSHSGTRRECPICGKSVVNLSSHTAQSHGKKNFPCSSCTSRFVSKSHLTVHVNNVHLKIKNKCIFCEKLCANLTSHRPFCKKS